VEKSFGLSHLAWKSRKRRGIPTLPTATATVNVYDASGKMIVVDRKEHLTPNTLAQLNVFVAPHLQATEAHYSLCLEPECWAC